MQYSISKKNEVVSIKDANKLLVQCQLKLVACMIAFSPALRIAHSKSELGFEFS